MVTMVTEGSGVSNKGLPWLPWLPWLQRVVVLVTRDYHGYRTMVTGSSDVSSKGFTR